jgi:hypothetical protein
MEGNCIQCSLQEQKQAIEFPWTAVFQPPLLRGSASDLGLMNP